MIMFWTAALALSLLLYVLLDGFDLGVGILSGFSRSSEERGRMLHSIAPVWDGNETWLVMTGTILFGAFPLVYALVLSAFYLPIILLLAALIFRGVAFEFRERSETRKWIWEAGFAVGSMVAAFVQGAAVGALVVGVSNVDGRYNGGAFDWLSPFSVLCGFGLCAGYALLGAGWLAMKTEGSLREIGYRALPRLLFGVLGFLGVAFLMTLAMELPVLQRWLERPVLILFPLAGIVGCYLILRGSRQRRDHWPFAGAVIIFLSAFLTLAVSFYPYMIPFSITIAQAAAPSASLTFLFWGGGLVALPVSLIYTVVVYRIFRGKIADGGYH